MKSNMGGSLHPGNFIAASTRNKKTLVLLLGRIMRIFLILSFFFSSAGINPASATNHQPTEARENGTTANMGTVVLVNADSPDYLDFQHFIQPYLDHFGIPYTVVDISTTPLSAELSAHAVIIIGHRNLDSGTTRYLTAEEEGFISTAVSSGSGLVNFDNALSEDGSTGRYQFITDIFTFGYNSATSGSDVVFADPALSYIIARHSDGQVITTNEMSLAGITLPGDVTALAASDGQPFVAITTYGNGHAVQFGSYDWISHNVKGPLFGLDDLFWRSIVWAARKPFVMQGLPPFVTMRMDDTSGPLWWIHAANDYGFIPWAGIFTNDIDAAEAADLSTLVNSGKATSTIHAFNNGTSRFFYYNHNAGTNYDDATMASHYAEATQWFAERNIPIGAYITPHYYEIGSNAFTGLQNWGVKYISTVMNPGQNETSALWMMAGPFRLYESGNAYERAQNIYYADYIPGYPGFFNCITEIRDVTGYEWLGNGRTDVSVAIADGVEWLKRPLDSMAIADLFSHEYTFISSMTEAQWRATLQGITSAIANYNPIYVSRDHACAYARAVHDSDITAAAYDSSTNRISVDLSGSTDMDTMFYVFTGDDNQVNQQLVDVPTFSGTTQVNYTLPGPLDHITVAPNPATVVAGTTQQFTATGYDVEENPINGLAFTWSVVNGGGTINASGLFTAGVTPGNYANTIRASFGSTHGEATVIVSETSLDHFSFDPISSPQFAGLPFSVTIRARDAANNPVVTYNGTAALTASAGTVSPVTVTFTNGVWTGLVSLPTTNTGVTLTANYLSASGTSNAFNVEAMRECPCSIWDETAIPDNVNVNDGQPIELGVKFQTHVDGYILGVRFYKGSLNTGTHTGHLWSRDGTLLAEAIFTNETASGWQEVRFDTPVAVTANTTYIASYFSPNGGFSDSENGLVNTVNNPPLRALGNGVDGGNAIYRYGSSGFPTSHWAGHGPNYWVDVVFDVTAHQTYSLWDNNATPVNPAVTDGVSIEVGVKFQASVSGAITGIRFYKGNANTGTHIGHLWSSSGTLLAEATFTNETVSGWQEVTFATPVSISANTNYVASYFSQSGYFAIDSGYLNTAVSNPPLRALANGEDGPNGVYLYNTSGFPTNGNGANYWVDILFQPDVPFDGTPPTVTSTSPVSNATGVNINTNISITFSEAIDPSTLTTNTFELRDAANNLVSAAVSYAPTTRTAILDPVAALTYSSVYTARVKGGTGGVTDLAGNPLAADTVWSFTTTAEPPPPPDEGPGGPILVIADVTSSNPFGRYYAEILRSEGFNAFFVTDISGVNPTTLAGYDVVLLAEMALSPAQVTMFTDWVNAGGNLVSFRPDKNLAAALGLTDAGGTTSEGYLLVNTATPIGAGIFGETMQFHGAADHYNLSGASSIATLYSNATTPTAYPAVVQYALGAGRAVIFTYDLARSVVLTRQGNPAWANQEGDGLPDALRATDLFAGRSGQPNWIDTSKILIPQADEQMHVLSHAIEQMNANQRPFPRLWYFPETDKGALIMTGDSEGCSGDCVNIPMQHVNSYGGHYTAYLLGTQPSSAQVNTWLANGNGVAPHYDDTSEASSLTWEGMNAVYDSMTQAHIAAYGLQPRTVRNHWVLWLGWSEQAEIEAAHGIQLDTNYYHYGSWLPDPGYFTGSGLPMRFSDENGVILDIFQSTTQLPDEKWGQNIFNVFKTLLDRSIDQGYYAFLNANFHPPSYGSYQTVAGNMMAYANTRGIPIWSAEDLLDFLLARNQVRMNNIAWDGTQLTFDVDQVIGAQHLTLMVPAQSSGQNLSTIRFNGSPVTYTLETIKGYEYALFPAQNGTFAASYAPDNEAPVISNVNALPASDGSALITWDTDEPSNSLVEYGGVSGALDLSTSNSVLVTSHSIALTGLAPSTIYYFQVTSQDAASNSATSVEYNFTTPAMTLKDTSLSDFNAATANTCYLSEMENGEIILSPALGAEFSGTSLPAGWSWQAWNPGGTAAVSGGALTVDGAGSYAAQGFGPGSSLEFRATFTPAQYQNVGFAASGNFDAPWIVIGQGQSTDGVYARTDTGTSILLSSTSLGAPHVYRIDWTATAFVFYVDGNQITTITRSVTTDMAIIVSDFNVAGGTLAVDWLRVTPYSSPCSLTSRVFDAGETVTWDAIAWDSLVPSSTSLGMSYRFGDTPTPDENWSAFIPVTASPAGIGSSARYIQYKADLAASDDSRTPVLQEVSFASHSGADTTPPVITNVVHTLNSETSATIAWTTNEPASSVVYYGTSPDVLNWSLSLGMLVTSHTLDLNGLTPNTTYYYRVSSTDASSNTATSPEPPAAPLTFTTPKGVLGDDLAADFNAGTLSCTYVSITDDGELILPPTVGAEFDGSSLPSGWEAAPWADGGSVTVNGGKLTLNLAYARTTTFYTPGRALEFVATFSNQTTSQSEHVGFANDFNESLWAAFSTKHPGGTDLWARSQIGGTSVETNLGSAHLGSPHLYRIEWYSDHVVYFIDGAQVANHTITISSNMRPVASDGADSSVLIIDWMRMSPFTGPCTFTSRVFDAGYSADWLDLNWAGSTPAGTTVSSETRTGDNPAPDGSWSAWQAVNSPISSPDGQYIQYRITLESVDLSQTPVIESVSLTFKTQDTSTHSIALVPGWNLVSFNLHPVDTSTAAVLSSIADKYTLVYAWDATGGHAGSGNWMKFDPNVSFGNTLTSLDETMGFWIYMTTASNLTVVGTVPTSTNISLSVAAGGWNLVGYPSLANRPLPGALSDHGVGTDFMLVYAYHASETADHWKLFDRLALPFANDLHELSPGWGYWINLSANRTWDVSYLED